jgi:hypothetical protein
MENINRNMKTKTSIQEHRTVPEVPGVTTYPVGTETISGITKLTGENAVGNVVVRACMVFSDTKDKFEAEGLSPTEANKKAIEFCLGHCAFRNTATEQNSERTLEERCAEKNSLDALERFGIDPKDAIFVAVTGNKVGFSDDFDKYIDDGSGIVNPEGWRQVSGYNAFFSDVQEAPVLARRLADCGDINIEFKTKEGKTIIGFMHLTRPGQTFGKDKRTFEYEGKKVSYFEHALREASEHYNIDWDSLNISLRTAIEGEDFQKHFDSYEAMEGHIPGWLEDGFVKNATNPDWKQGDPVKKEDTFYADFKGIILQDIHEAYEHLGLKEEQFDMSNMLETMHNPEQSSYERAMREKILDTRDLYMTIHKSAVHL